MPADIQRRGTDMNAVKALTEYALGKGLIEACESIWAMNTIIDVIGADDIPDIEVPDEAELSVILDALTDFAYENGTLK
jgi:UDPglucose--hexose-1-phosphate uridylyltransferase